MQDNISIFKWFWAWQDEEEEEWLKSMSARGFHLARAPRFSFYTFTAGDPLPYVYRLDFNDRSKGKADYLQLYKDAGWQHLGQWQGWQYFRKLASPGESTEIFTDNASKVLKYKRVLGYLFTILPVYLLAFLPGFDSYPAWFKIFLVVFFFTSLVFLGIAIQKIEKRIKTLQAI